MRIVALASHGGTIVQTVVDACHRGDLDAEVVLVVSNNSNSLALERAMQAGIATKHLSQTTHQTAEALDAALCDTLLQMRADCVLLGGYMKKLGPKVLAQYSGRIVNTHPSLLPKYGGKGFYGRKIHEAVVDAKESITGATVHFVEAEYDTGPVLAQVSLAITANDTVDTVEKRVRKAERRLIVAALRHLADQLSAPQTDRQAS